MSSEIQALISRLGNGNRQQRIALSQLIHMRETAVEPLIEAFSSEKNPEIQASLIKILSKIGDKRAIPVFTNLLLNDESAPRYVLMNALKRMNADEPFYQALSSSNTRLREMALMMFGEKLLEEDIPKLATFLKDSDEHIRGRAVRLLAQAKSPEINAILLNKASFQDMGIRYQLLHVLMKQEKDTIFKVLHELLPDADKDLKISIMHNLRSVPDERSLQIILACLKDKDETVHTRAALEIGMMKYSQAEENLIAVLHHKSWELRAQALRSLVMLKQAGTAKILLHALHDVNEKVRLAAAQGLGKIKDKRAVEALTPLITDTDYYLRNAVLLSLRSLGDKSAVPALLEAWESRSYDWQFGSLLIALGRTDIVESYIQMLDSDNPKQVLQGIRIFDYYGYQIKDNQKLESAIPTLIRLLKHKDREIGEASVRILSRLKKPETQQVLLQLIEENDPLVKYIGLWMLRDIPETERNRIIQKILANPDKTMFRSHVLQLGRMGENQVTPLLVDFLKDESFEQRYQVAEVLGKLKDERAIEPLLWALQESEIKHVRVDIRAAWALGELGNKETFPALMTELRIAIDNDDSTAVGALAWALAKMDAVQAVDMLIEATPMASVSLIHAFAKLGDSRATEALVPMLENKRESIREAAVMALRKIGDERAVDGLMIFINQAEGQMRIHAIEALSHVANARASEVLIQALYEKHPRIRKAASQGLRRIGKAALAEILAIDFKNEQNLLALRRLIWLCGEIGDAQASAKLIAVVEESSDLLSRAHAIQALGKIGNKDALKSLLKTSQDSSSYIRAATATALGKLKDVDVRASLEVLAEDVNENVRRAAKRRLERQ